jgi:DNA polymerase alpha subunit A
LKESLEMGKKLKLEVNVLYKQLEIEIDGVFKSLLLLKKKKYAALKVDDFAGEGLKISKEVKGLDMVRRDWCNLSKEVGNKVLDEILSGKDREKIIVELNDYFSDMSKRMRTNQLEINKYIITKQLTKAPSEYSDYKALPHVAIALKLKQ